MLYYGKKLVIFMISVGLLSLVTFYVSRLAPGDPLFSYYGERVEKMSPEEREWAEEKLGLNDKTSWMSIAKIIRTEVRQLRNNEYVIAARCMGGGFFYILYKHLAPNFLSSIMFMVVMNIRSAIVEESTLSFIGIGLPLEVISWGSMLSLSEKALLTGAWWIILIPGVFLVVTLLCITSIGDCIRKKLNKQESNL